MAAKKQRSAPKQHPSKPIGPEKKQPDGNGRYLWTALGLMAAVLAVFSSALGNDFVSWDDHVYVFENPWVLNPVGESFRELGARVISLNYHPVTMWSLWLNAKLFGPGDAGHFILVNILLHGVNTVLAYRLAWHLSGKNYAAALLTALFFGLHPLRVESVVWVSERKDVLYVCFFLLGCLSYLKYLETRTRKQLLIVGVFFLLSCLSKATAVVFPVVLLLLDYWHKRPFNFGLFLEKIHLFALSLLFGLIALDIQDGGDFHGWLTVAGGTRDDALSAANTLSDKFRFAGYGFMMYWAQFFAPTGLCTFYPYPTKTGIDANPLFLLGPVFFIGAVAATALFWKRRPVVSFSIGFFLTTVALVLQFVQVGLVVMADRYSYLPHFGLAFLLGFGIQSWVEKNRPEFVKAWQALAVLFIIVMSYRAFQQSKTWKDTEALWQTALKFYPDNDVARETLANWYGKKNRIPDAVQQLETALQDGASRARIYSTLGNCYAIQYNAQQGGASPERMAKIRELYEKAISMEPDKGVHYIDFATTIFSTDPAKAVELLGKALPLIPDKEAVIRGMRGMCLVNLKNYQQGHDDLAAAIRLNEQLPAARRTGEVKMQLAVDYRNKAVARFYLNDKAGALDDLNKSLTWSPNDPATLNVKKQIESAN